MPTQAYDTKQLLRTVEHDLHELSKRWWLIARLSQLAVLGIGGHVTLTGNTSFETGIFVSSITVFSVAAQWRSDFFRGKAQTALRKFELLDGLNWKIDPREIRDLKIRLPKGVKKKLEIKGISDFKYFESEHSPSTKRLMENLTESTYWSKHIAERSSLIFGVLSLIIFAIAVLFFVLAIINPTVQPIGVAIAKVSISLIVFGFSAGFVRLAYDFWIFAQSAGSAETTAWTLLHEAQIDFSAAVKVLQEYQLARAAAPLLPTWLYKLMNNELNKRWTEYVKEQQKS